MHNTRNTIKNLNKFTKFWYESCSASITLYYFHFITYFLFSLIIFLNQFLVAFDLNHCSKFVYYSPFSSFFFFYQCGNNLCCLNWIELKFWGLVYLKISFIKKQQQCRKCTIWDCAHINWFPTGIVHQLRVHIPFIDWCWATRDKHVERVLPTNLAIAEGEVIKESSS